VLSFTTNNCGTNSTLHFTITYPSPVPANAKYYSPIGMRCPTQSSVATRSVLTTPTTVWATATWLIQA
jgi:hypothetical protein